ncbi:MAG TPA: hypothetical protein VJS38_04360 [Phenylobacterium sp.]|uniref:hypothetical protein n=1 Tax=Phenylobacterium sp. TaxID=1871053 RepID=UPI002B498EA6|nr:hypothetical protein [Phenylobacterium sp.]HKR87383.1 hypothetical protein [Phenylobacterium sp.]HKT54904.1 hypothetical protein [Caulobacteraceae bacterium]
MLEDFGTFFELYVDDDRYVVPTLRFFIAINEMQARQMAARLLTESPHHLGVEVRVGDRRVDALGSFATRRS